MRTMRAAQFHSYGPPEVITVSIVRIPHPGPGEVLVRVLATTVNIGELFLRLGRLRAVSGRHFPKGLGIDLVGDVAKLGEGVSGLAVGDRVWGVTDSKKAVRTQAPTGAAAEYVVLDAQRTARPPADLDPAESVALLTGTTALTALRDRAGLVPGERVLVRGGTGGVGYVGLQVARTMGAHVTTLVSGGNLGVAKDLGAHLALDYAVTAPESLAGFDVILDTVGSDMARYRRLLTPTGRMVTISVDPVLRGVLTILASTVHGSRRIQAFSGEPRRPLLNDMADLARDGHVRPLIDSVHRLQDIASAHRSAAARGGHGKRIVTIGP